MAAVVGVVVAVKAQVAAMLEAKKAEVEPMAAAASSLQPVQVAAAEGVAWATEGVLPEGAANMVRVDMVPQSAQVAASEAAMVDVASARYEMLQSLGCSG